jgi:hypothetical protein
MNIFHVNTLYLIILLKLYSANFFLRIVIRCQCFYGSAELSLIVSGIEGMLDCSATFASTVIRWTNV